MAVKVAFAVGLFCVVFSMFGSSQDIPDGVVYTEVKKTLVNGTMGILRCRFQGLPNGVFWKKGSDPAKSPSIIIWSYGEKSGPGYEDGSCDIDENYSLVIRNVRNTDAGRYICRVSNYKGILIYNYTDVMITNSAVRTEQSVAVQKGEVGVIPCQVNIRPRRVSWVRGANDTLVSMDLSRRVVERSGPGYEEGLFNITKEYSLLINDIKILHEDSYFCEVTDFDTGHLFRNVTRLNVFAFPLELYPSIEECPREQQDLSSCTLRIASQTALTCEVREYYPVIDLFFAHGSLRVDSLETRVWNNSDGTRNIRITIATNGSIDAVYECIARGLVGQAESRTMTIHLIRNVQQTRVAVAVIVPVIIFSTIIVIAVYVMKRWKRHSKRKYANVPTLIYTTSSSESPGKLTVSLRTTRDLISYIELWTLVKYAREQNLGDKLGQVLDKPIQDEERSKTLQTDEDYYQEFCQWKVGYTGTCQRKDFFKACKNADLKSAIDKLQKYSDSNRAVTADDLEHTLWHIAESDRIIGLLEDLSVQHETLAMLKNKGKREVVEGAMNILKHWRDVNSSGNQEVMLSLALETINYTPSEKDFFRIPDCQKRGLDESDIQAVLLPQITSRHCTELVDAMVKFKKENRVAITLRLGSNSRDIWKDNIIEQDRTDLFDSHQMIEDWWAEQNCSNYEKRYRLRQAAKVLEGRTDDLVPQDAQKESDEREENNEIFSEPVRAIKYDGVQARPKGKLIYKAELVDLALDMIMEDFRPLADALGVTGSKFTSYRKDFRSSHLGLGTISLLSTLVNLIDSASAFTPIRRSLSSILDNAGYLNAMKRVTFAFEPSYGELFAIATAVVEDDKTKVDMEVTDTNEEKNTVKEPEDDKVVEINLLPSIDDGERAELLSDDHKTPRLLASQTSIDVDKTEKNDNGGDVSTNDFKVVCKIPMDESKNEIKSNLAVSLRENDLGDLQRMLELTDEDIPDSNMASVLTLLKIWKERVCPGLLDHRLVLAKGLQKINKPHLVAAVINGQYQSRGTSTDFIDDMLSRMDGSQRTSLKRLLQSKQDKTKWLQSSDITSQWICDWLVDWINEMESSVKNYLKEFMGGKEASEIRRDFNDELVDHGFLDLAREIMNIEQVL